MKAFFTAVFLLISIYSSIAQVKHISPLPCDTWNTNAFLSFEEVQRKVPAPKGPYAMLFNTSESVYNDYTNSKAVYSWIYPENEYVNNIQVVRWTIQDDKSLYKYEVKTIYDEVLYKINSDNSCGLIIFPDSLIDQGVLFVEIKPKDPNYHPFIQNFSEIILFPGVDKQKRVAVLKEIQACSTLACKIEILASHNKILDILSLLELEKMKDPQNPAVDKLYWEYVSILRYKRSAASEER